MRSCAKSRLSCAKLQMTDEVVTQGTVLPQHFQLTHWEQSANKGSVRSRELRLPLAMFAASRMRSELGSPVYNGGGCLLSHGMDSGVMPRLDLTCNDFVFHTFLSEACGFALGGRARNKNLAMRRACASRRLGKQGQQLTLFWDSN